MQSTVGPAGGKRKSWPKVHLIYFILAAFDLLAVAGGLFLSHQVIRVFQNTVEANAEWDGRLMTSWDMVDAVADANAAVIGAFESAGTEQALSIFRSKAQEFRTRGQEFRTYVDHRFPPGAAKRANSILGKLDVLMAGIETDAARVFANLEAGDEAGAVKALSAMQRRNTNLRFQVRDLNRLVSMVKVGKAEQSEKTVAGLRKYEYAIGAAIGFMVCCIVLYGHWIGRIMRRKYEEAQAAHEAAEDYARELSSVNDGMIALNAELAANMQRLKDAQEEIIRRAQLAQLGQLTATVAHELRSPLSTLRASAYVLDRKTSAMGLGLETHLQRINAGVARCDSIITQLLDFARSQALQCEPVRLDEWLARLLEEEAQKLPPIVSVSLKGGLGELEVSIDRDRMARVVINLLTNASEALVGKGNDPSKFATADPKITVATRRSARGVELVVADNGPGVAPENLEKIMRPLFTTKSFGTGLGLPAVEKVLRLHEGGLEVESTPGKGAAFIAWFPIGSAIGKAA